MPLKNKKLLVFVADQFEEMELFYPKIRLIEEGAKIVIAGEKAQEVYKGKNGYPCPAEISFEQAQAKDFDGLIIPGGYAPDKIRRNQKALEITQDFHKQEKLIAFICHAGWVPISAKIVKGITCTSFPAIKDDLINAGANWVDEKVVIDRHFITSRSPADLPYFCPAIIQYLS